MTFILAGAILITAIAVFLGPELTAWWNAKQDGIGPLPRYVCDECAQGFDEDTVHYYRDGDEPCFGKLIGRKA